MLDDLTISSVRRGLAQGTHSARELAEAHLDRIARLDPSIAAIVTLNPDALAEAEHLDRDQAGNGKFVGPLHGVPVVVKDIFETAGLATSFGCSAVADYVPATDAAAVGRLRAAGAVVLAKTSMPDFAASWHGHSSRSGVTRNPHNLARDPGGSSSGTAAAVAAGFAVAGLGSDTGGSIRVPASFCGLVGLRTTPGVISRAGTCALVVEQDVPGPMARTVADAALLLDAMAGWDPADPYTAIPARRQGGRSFSDALTTGGLQGARLGVVRDFFGDSTRAEQAEVNAVMEQALRDLRAGGAELIDPVAIDGLPEDLMATFMYFAQSRHDINGFLAGRDLPYADVAEIVSSGQIWPTLVLLQVIASGPDDPFTDPTHGPGRARRDALTRKVAALFAEHRLDALVFPDVKMAAPLRADIDAGRWEEAAEGVNHPDRGLFPVNTLLASQALLPAVTVPAGLAASGMPVGLEFLGLPMDDARLLGLAHDYELLTGHRRAVVLDAV